MEKVLKKSRPHLRHRSPLIYYISWAYGITNILIGAGIYQTPKAALSRAYPFVQGPFGPHFYGAIFFGMGAVGVFSLLFRHWELTRRVMTFGLAVKSLFFYGLLANLRTHFWDFISITAIWALITITQFLTVVYFPKENNNGSDRK